MKPEDIYKTQHFRLRLDEGHLLVRSENSVSKATQQLCLNVIIAHLKKKECLFLYLFSHTGDMLF